ncbi:MAG TPA: GDP-L-fucose synthase [Pyrinomonadaceae bacterium]|nr:GDP-L-fucose synthase [Pyrinomonadaceae bacterium]
MNSQSYQWANALAGKRICVTGGEGFLGRRVVASLRERGHLDVFVVRHSDYDLVRGVDVKWLYRDVRPQVVIHLAAVVGGIGANMESPGRFFYENLMMGAQLMEGARLHGVEKFVQVGTICSYPKHTPVPFDEEDLWGGYPEETNAPYGIAKKALLVQGQAYRDQYGLNAVYLLPTNLYGPGDNFAPESSHVIPALIRKLTEAVGAGAPAVEVWGTGRATREFLYVDDAAEGVVLAAERYDGRDPVNLGAGGEVSIRELAGLIAAETGFRGQLVWDHSRPDGQPRRAVDSTRARELFGFRARTEFAEGLRRTVEWYRHATASGRPAFDLRTFPRRDFGGEFEEKSVVA